MNLKRLLLIVLTALMLLSLASCELLNKLPFDIPGLTDKENGDENDEGNGENDGGEEDENTPSGNVLIKDKKAYFTVVYTSEADATEKESVKCLLRSEIVRIYYANRSRRALHSFEYENVAMLYHAYKEMGGNSFVDRIWEEISEWEILP